MTPDEPINGIRLSAVALSDEEILRRVKEMVDGRMKSGGLSPFPMRPSQGYISLVSHVPLWPQRAPFSSHFPVPLFAFAVCAGDEGHVSLPAARSRGHRAASQEQGIRRGMQEAEGRQGGKAQEEKP